MPGTTSGNRTSSRRRRALQRLCASTALALLAALFPAQTVSGAADVPAASAATSPLPSLDRGIEDRILALDPLHISAAEVRDVLKRAPAPRIIADSGKLSR